MIPFGPIFDCAHGIYIPMMVIEYAESLGYEVPHEYIYDRNPDTIFYYEHYEHVEEWLNDNIANERGRFGYTENGDWGYWNMDDSDD